MNLDNEWLNFSEDNMNDIEQQHDNLNLIDPECTNIYISTKTKISYLNTEIDLNSVFWNLPTINYHIPKEGILKKTMKINCINQEEVNTLENKIKNEKNITVDILNQINIKTKKGIKFKDVRKVTIGLSSKDVINQRKKKKSAFYNCFAVIYRMRINNRFKEIHVKIFNTGKLEIPGVQNDQELYYTLDKVCIILSNILKKQITYNKKETYNVLINSNFKCNYYIDREKLFNLLKFKYNIHSLYDPCSYPGIQCKFYYNVLYKDNKNGICNCKNKCGYTEKSVKKTKKNICVEISFMIFRTGSVLIVGHCEEYVLDIVYKFLKNILIKEYKDIRINYIPEPPKIKKKIVKFKKKSILFTEKPVYTPIGI
tara:strand:- start:13389 stop:14495 length:1107 start_codon:yes stop_codon:yes gene_type:complete